MTYKAPETHMNLFDSVHGGVSASLIDNLSTLALVDDKDDFMERLGVSVDLNVSWVIY